MLFLDGREAYELFLESAFWRRLSWTKRKGQCCERCGSRKRLQAHHRFYREHWFDTELDDLEVLCRKCHEKEHGIVPKVKKPKKPNKKKELKKRFSGFDEVKTARSKGQISRSEYLYLKRVFCNPKSLNKKLQKKIKRLKELDNELPRGCKMLFQVQGRSKWVNRGTSSN